MNCARQLWHVFLFIAHFIAELKLMWASEDAVYYEYETDNPDISCTLWTSVRNKTPAHIWEYNHLFTLEMTQEMYTISSQGIKFIFLNKQVVFPIHTFVKALIIRHEPWRERIWASVASDLKVKTSSGRTWLEDYCCVCFRLSGPHKRSVLNSQSYIYIYIWICTSK